MTVEKIYYTFTAKGRKFLLSFVAMRKFLGEEKIPGRVWDTLLTEIPQVERGLFLEEAFYGRSKITQGEILEYFDERYFPGSECQKMVLAGYIKRVK
jgi:hypothetical protein